MPYTYSKNKDGSHTVYKKDTGEKVGTTKGDVKKYLAALHANIKEQFANAAQARAMASRTSQVMGGSTGGSSAPKAISGPTQVSGPSAVSAPKAVSGPTQVSAPSQVSSPSQSENELLENYLYNLQEKNWSDKVKLKHHFKKGTFKKSPGLIVKRISGSGGGCRKQMARITFYINRAGRNLKPEMRARLERTKQLLHQRCSKNK